MQENHQVHEAPEDLSALTRRQLKELEETKKTPAQKYRVVVKQ